MPEDFTAVGWERFKKCLQCESVARAYRTTIFTSCQQRPHDLSQDTTIQGTEAWDLITGGILITFQGIGHLPFLDGDFRTSSSRLRHVCVTSASSEAVPGDIRAKLVSSCLKHSSNWKVTFFLFSLHVKMAMEYLWDLCRQSTTYSAVNLEGQVDVPLEEL